MRRLRREYWQQGEAALPRHRGSLTHADLREFYWPWIWSLTVSRGSLSDAWPWITFPAAQILRSIVTKTSRVFEFGVGGSTLFFARRAGELVSVEHDREWLDATTARMKRHRGARWSAHLAEPIMPAEPNPYPPSDPLSYGSTDPKFIGMSFRDYACAIERYDDHSFDVVLIDGRARPACFRHAVAKVKPGGYIVLDNAEREAYAWVEAVARKLGFEVRECWGPGPYNEYFWRTIFLRRSHERFALNNLDWRLEGFLDHDGGTFVEAGANDGIAQSNTLYFERQRGWRGLLVEPVPALATECRRNRPHATVENAALVPSDYALPQITLRYANLMSTVKGGMRTAEEEDAHIRAGCEVQKLGTSFELSAPVATLSGILEKRGIAHVDLLSLDVEGYELNALKGIDWSKHRPKFILVEARYRDEVHAYLSELYELVAELSLHDLLYRLKAAVPNSAHAERAARLAEPRPAAPPKPTVYALVPVHNRLEDTRKVVQCLRSQSHAPLRTVVIDDGSTDGTREFLEAQPDLTRLGGDGNLWWAGAIQVGLEHALARADDGDYVLFVNNDTTFDPDWVAKLVETSVKECNAVVGSILRDADSHEKVHGLGPVVDVWTQRVWELHGTLPEAERASLAPVYAVDALSGRGTLYPVEVFRKVGTLRPGLLPHYYADYEIAMRARRGGFPVVVSTTAPVYSRDDFSVQRAEPTWRETYFGRRSPRNVFQRAAFFSLVGPSAARATAAVRMPYLSVERTLHRLACMLRRAARAAIARVPASARNRIRGISRAAATVARTPRSGAARARVYMGLLQRKPGVTYNAWHAYSAGSIMDVFGKRVLVVGCNTGRDCAYFVRMGARAVHGLDVVGTVGSEYKHRRVSYFRASAEAIPARDGAYDLVYCFATMEHVPDVDSAFAEMARVTRAGGVIYSVASPLWNSRYGHHKGDLFEHFPWIHLRMTKEEITKLCAAQGIVDPSGRYPMETHVAYMLDPRYFNMAPATRYVAACQSLPGVEVLENSLASDPDELLTEEVYDCLRSKGYSRDELLAVTHTFIGRKIARDAGT